MGKWTTEFPTKVGIYWFYGYRYGKYFDLAKTKKNKPEFMLVRVWKCANGLMHTADGQFMYKSEIEEGHFIPAELPKWPKMDGTEY